MCSDVTFVLLVFFVVFYFYDQHIGRCKKPNKYINVVINVVKIAQFINYVWISFCIIFVKMAT